LNTYLNVPGTFFWELQKLFDIIQNFE